MRTRLLFLTALGLVALAGVAFVFTPPARQPFRAVGGLVYPPNATPPDLIKDRVPPPSDLPPSIPPSMHPKDGDVVVMPPPGSSYSPVLIPAGQSVPPMSDLFPSPKP